MTPFAGWEAQLSAPPSPGTPGNVRLVVSLMSLLGVFLAEGPARCFLDAVNDVLFRQINESVYTHFIRSDANVIDDLLSPIAAWKNISVVNAANEDKDWAWLNAVKAKSWSIRGVLHPFLGAM